MIQQSNKNQAELSIERTRFNLSQTYQLRLIGRNHPQRNVVECFIASRFARIHDARITSFMPLLLALFDTSNEIRAAIGVRAASNDKLFLEHYFDHPIEEIIVERSANSGRAVIRDQVVEVGNLASIDRYASRRLFEQLAFFLIKKRFQWIVFTGCKSLRQVFRRMQLHLVEIGRAEESRLPASFGRWGRYYQDNPQVLLGHLSEGIGLAQRAGRLVPKAGGAV